MEQKVYLRYYNESLMVGMADIRNVYLLYPNLIKLHPEVYKGKLVYRAKGSNRRISYDKVKSGLVRKNFMVRVTVPDWL